MKKLVLCVCGKKFFLFPSKIKSSKKHYCSRSCYVKFFSHSKNWKKDIAKKTTLLWRQDWFKKKMREARIGRRFSTETRKKLSTAQKKLVVSGRHSFWKGGITPINHKIRMSSEYKLWRKSVFERDNYTCIWCSTRNGNGKSVILNADHIKPFALYPALRFSIDNGRTLCVPCHKKTDTYGLIYRPQLA